MTKNNKAHIKTPLLTPEKKLVMPSCKSPYWNKPRRQKKKNDKK